jgi:Phage integrase family
MLLASTGMRAVEALSIRIKDLDLESSSAKAFVRGEYTKTRVDRTVFLTKEITEQLNSWLSYKYRTRRVCYKDDNQQSEAKTITEYRTPDKKSTDLVFAASHDKIIPDPVWLYNELAKSFAKTLDRIGKGTREDSTKRRRQITLHSFRRFVKTTISDLGYSDFSEWFIGHSGSTYWTKKESEKTEIFRKVEPYLTFLDFAKLEAKGADVETKLQDKDKQIEALAKKQEQFEQFIQSLIDSGQVRPTNRVDT